MEEKEPATKDPVAYLLEAILLKNTSFAHAPVEISASPEEGVRLIRAFICIKQPEFAPLLSSSQLKWQTAQH